MSTRKYIYDFEKVLQERDAADVLKSEYTSTNEIYGDLLSAFDGTSTNYYEPDALGSTDALIDEAQAVKDRWKYRAFGAATHTFGTSINPSTFIGRQNYRDDFSETSLYMLGASPYDPAICQFTCKDPLGVRPESPNDRTYAGNNPVNFIDPSGMAMVMANTLYGAGVRYISDRYPPWQQAEGQAEVGKKTIDVNNRLAKVAIRDAVEKALIDLNVAVKPSLGDHIKASLTAGDFEKIKMALGDKLETATTISGEKASRVKINDTWELKIYCSKNGEFSAAVGHFTVSFQHAIDVARWFATEVLGLPVATVPNGENAERFLGRMYYDTNSLIALENFKSSRHVGETPFDRVLAEWIQRGRVHIGVTYLEAAPPAAIVQQPPQPGAYNPARPSQGLIPAPGDFSRPWLISPTLVRPPSLRPPR